VGGAGGRQDFGNLHLLNKGEKGLTKPVIARMVHTTVKKAAAAKAAAKIASNGAT
jgi:hypothetical protein